RAHRGTHAARPALGAALYRSAPNRGRRRRRGHVHLLPAEGGPARPLGRSHQGPATGSGAARGRPRDPLRDRSSRGDTARRHPVRRQSYVRCILDIDNQAAWHRLRARLPVGLPGTAAVAGTAFGSVARPPIAVDPADFPLEAPVRTAPAHGFVAAASGARGLALFAPGFFEYEWTGRGDLLVTLLRAVGELSRGDLPTRPGHAGWPTSTPLAQCPARPRVELAIVPVSDAELDRV